MRLALLGFLLSVVVGGALAGQIQTNPNEPAPYPDGVYCTPTGDNFHGLQTPDHPCHCHMMMRSNADGCCEILQNNDPVCKQYCREKNCACPHECIVDTPAEKPGPN